MPNEEVEIMRDMFCFLRDHNDPPRNGTDGAPDWWLKAVKDMGSLDEKWRNHPLAQVVLMALFEYLEQKAKAEGDNRW